MTAKTDNRPVVLVVDDRKNMLNLMSKVLRKDVRVRTSECGSDAIRTLQSETVHVILSDLRMPDMDGSGRTTIL
jgi:response regulator RpfG family c-di-GMP phosphodiesterase